MATVDVVTGAFSYTGSFIARRLLAAGHQVRTLTNNPNPPADLAKKVARAPLNFDDSEGLVRFMRGADTLYNTYWIHSNHGADAFRRRGAPQPATLCRGPRGRDSAPRPHQHRQSHRVRSSLLRE